MRIPIKVILLSFVLLSCSDDISSPLGEQRDIGLDARSADLGAAPDEAPDLNSTTDDGPDAWSDLSSVGTPFVVSTFNTGTGPGDRHDDEPDDGYSSDDALITDTWYGNGLNWPPLIEDTRAFFDTVQPDLVTFQEIFWSGECPSIPLDAQVGFICEGWEAGDPTVVQLILGDAYQIACHPGKPDKCAAVKKSFGTFDGCESDLCLEGMTGFGIEGCGSGARVARVRVNLVDSGTLTLVNVHGSSGLSTEDKECRAKQVEQVFVNLGDGEPGANGARNLIMGDLNTDPGRFAVADVSAARWLDFVGSNRAFSWITEVGREVSGTYGAVNIDHVVSDVFDGACWHAGLAGTDDVSSIKYFDHRPAVCELRMPPL